ncbi:unnamed protein product [Anisakis simplex]|uniref:Integron gene cassette protein n=1 Tax=Anisakis simplex TaxID=6269 RepID=A0A0M3JYX4_ANISI|nr:unnamed protein product [Anisakis simplex]
MHSARGARVECQTPRALLKRGVSLPRRDDVCGDVKRLGFCASSFRNDDAPRSFGATAFEQSKFCARCRQPVLSLDFLRGRLNVIELDGKEER